LSGGASHIAYMYSTRVAPRVEMGDISGAMRLWGLDIEFALQPRNVFEYVQACEFLSLRIYARNGHLAALTLFLLTQVFIS